MDYYYEFCGVRFRVSAPLAMSLDKNAAVFETAPASPDVTLTVSPSEQLTPRGEFLAQRGEKQVWRDGSTVLRLTKDVFRPEPYLLSSYRLDAPQTVTCHARQEYWQWATRSNYLWPGVSLPQLLLYHSTLVFHAAYTGTSGICRNVSMPLRCIVLLSQAPENRIRRLGASEALALLPQNAFADASVREEWQRTLSLLLDLIAAVPVYALACTPDVRAVETLEHALVRDGF